jgi:hypothetical protein
MRHVLKNAREIDKTKFTSDLVEILLMIKKKNRTIVDSGTAACVFFKQQRNKINF